MHGGRRGQLGLTLLTAVALAGCLDPADRRPGLRLRGDVAQAFPSDWSFAQELPLIALEVRAPYLLSHSVTIWCSVVGGQLYVGARNPESKRWPRWVARNPDVRLRIQGVIYEARLSQIDAADQVARISSAYAAKYKLPSSPPQGAPPMRFWRVDPRG